MSLIKEYLKLVEEEKQKKAEERRKFYKSPFGPIDNNILFITGRKKYYFFNSNEHTGFIQFNKKWYKSGTTKNKVQMTNIKTNAKILVYIINEFNNGNNIYLENIPFHIEKVYFLYCRERYIINQQCLLNFEEDIKKKVKFPFGCQYKIITEINEIKELKTDCKYPIHTFLIPDI